MPTTTAPRPSRKTRSRNTVAHLLRYLGVPARRVLLDPAPGTATEADVIALCNGEPKQLVELVRGTLFEKDMGFPESLMAAELIRLIGNFVVQHRHGRVAGADGLARFLPGVVRIPDVSFTSWVRWPKPGTVIPQIADWAPDLCIEVLSPRNSRREMQLKRQNYFAGGSKLVWQFDPSAETVVVYTDEETGTTLTKSDVLTGGEVLPGFTLSLAELFAPQGPPTG
jgi:Uma2 family endonuclease